MRHRDEQQWRPRSALAGSLGNPEQSSGQAQRHRDERGQRDDRRGRQNAGHDLERSRDLRMVGRAPRRGHSCHRCAKCAHRTAPGAGSTRRHVPLDDPDPSESPSAIIVPQDRGFALSSRGQVVEIDPDCVQKVTIPGRSAGFSVVMAGSCRGPRGHIHRAGSGRETAPTTARSANRPRARSIRASRCRCAASPSPRVGNGRSASPAPRVRQSTG